MIFDENDKVALARLILDKKILYRWPPMTVTRSCHLSQKMREKGNQTTGGGGESKQKKKKRKTSAPATVTPYGSFRAALSA